MRIVFDTNVLVQAIAGTKAGCTLSNPANGENIPDLERRMDALIDHVEANRGKIIIPTPVLAEYLVGIDKSHHQTHLNLIQCQSCFEIAPFDEIAAIEYAQMPSIKELKAMMAKDTANKVKFDRQIISIAIALNVDEVWTHDKGVYNRCNELGIVAKSLADITPAPIQGLIDLSNEFPNELH
ncbi:type II toxin-antitoxin system VapC family toxin [Pectobacterium carotovorum]|uniref:type II toxin-antitoxin system VapC family toxin n=1 Tax=Pectobacterium carotovorum TaxID=554 RepID=UPI0010FED879|nr:type II toxin-antitoxin system VapC family toxin [Pectobacterium carotovorum]KAA3669540.1 type II toxin-antitoxin system VapC family toxin [Pectobacterium carotovorum subsp. carotovorum]UCZ79419.1 type II toxin-antitoxin system VapC family toxin [Pectobacterium carotovorum]